MYDSYPPGRQYSAPPPRYASQSPFHSQLGRVLSPSPPPQPPTQRYDDPYRRLAPSPNGVANISRSYSRGYPDSYYPQHRDEGPQFWRAENTTPYAAARAPMRWTHENGPTPATQPSTSAPAPSYARAPSAPPAWPVFSSSMNYMRQPLLPQAGEKFATVDELEQACSEASIASIGLHMFQDLTPLSPAVTYIRCCLHERTFEGGSCPHRIAADLRRNGPTSDTYSWTVNREQSVMGHNHSPRPDSMAPWTGPQRAALREIEPASPVYSSTLLPFEWTSFAPKSPSPAATPFSEVTSTISPPQATVSPKEIFAEPVQTASVSPAVVPAPSASSTTASDPAVLPLPALGTTFASRFEAQTCASKALHSQGHALVVWSGARKVASGATEHVFGCPLGASRFPDDKRCPFRLKFTIEASNTGVEEYSVAELIDLHNHPAKPVAERSLDRWRPPTIGPQRQARKSAAQLLKEKEEVQDVDDEVAVLFGRRAKRNASSRIHQLASSAYDDDNDPTPTTKKHKVSRKARPVDDASPLVPLVTSPVNYRSSSPSIASPSIQPAATQPIPPSFNLAFLPTLTSFLLSLVPELSHKASTFLNLGLDSIESLVVILSLSDSRLDELLAYDDTINDGTETLTALQKMQFKKAIRGVRDAAKASRETKGGEV